jgi:hypothetical protein
MGEAKRRRKAAAKAISETDRVNLEKAAHLIVSVIDEAARRGMQVFLRPTVTPSPHGPSGPIQIETSEDGQRVTITLFGLTERQRQSFVARSLAGARIVREIRA